MRKVAAAIITVVTTLLVTLQAPSAQQRAIPSGQGVPSGTAIMADGATDPDLIRTESAIRIMVHLWVTALNKESPWLFDGSTSRMQLGSRDMATLRTEIASAQPRIVEITDRLSGARGANVTALFEEWESATLDVYGRLLELMSAEGRLKLRQHVEFVKSRTLALRPSVEDIEQLAQAISQNPTRPATAVTVSGRLRHVRCGPVPILELDTGADRLRLQIDDGRGVIVLGLRERTVNLDCGDQDVPVTVGYDPVVDDPNGVVGTVRILDYRQP